MAMFESRERAFEAKHAHDEEFRFLVTVRRDRLMAQLAAQRIGMPDRGRDELTAAVLALRDGPGHDALPIQHVAGVLLDQGSALEAAEAATRLKGCAELTRWQLLDAPLASQGLPRRCQPPHGRSGWCAAKGQERRLGSFRCCRSRGASA